MRCASEVWSYVFYTHAIRQRPNKRTRSFRSVSSSAPALLFLLSRWSPSVSLSLCLSFLVVFSLELFLSVPLANSCHTYTSLRVSTHYVAAPLLSSFPNLRLFKNEKREITLPIRPLNRPDFLFHFRPRPRPRHHSVNEQRWSLSRNRGGPCSALAWLVLLGPQRNRPAEARWR